MVNKYLFVRYSLKCFVLPKIFLTMPVPVYYSNITVSMECVISNHLKPFTAFEGFNFDKNNKYCIW